MVVPNNLMRKLIEKEEEPIFSYFQLSRHISSSVRLSFSFESHVNCLMVCMTSLVFPLIVVVVGSILVLLEKEPTAIVLFKFMYITIELLL